MASSSAAERLPVLIFAFKGPGATICSAVAEEVGSEVRTAGDRTRRTSVEQALMRGLATA
jgi:hypothetical protein